MPAQGLGRHVVALGRNRLAVNLHATAINLATGLAKEGYNTCLVDLDLQFGDVMGYLDIVSDTTLADAHRALERDAASFRVEDYLTE